MARPADGALQALRAYRNADGGFGWALEADLRAPSSQPAGALHAFEVLEEAAPRDERHGAGPLRLAGVGDPSDDGGLPFSVAGAATPGTAPWWAGAEPGAGPRCTSPPPSSRPGHAVAARDPRVASHPWLARATAFCRREITAHGEPLRRLRAALLARRARRDRRRRPRRPSRARAPRRPRPAVRRAAGRRAAWRTSGLRALDLSPRPGRPLRDVLPTGTIEGDLDRLEAGPAGRRGLARRVAAGLAGRRVGVARHAHAARDRAAAGARTPGRLTPGG